MYQLREMRALLRRATQLLQEAGLKRGADGILRLANGEPFAIEFLDFQPSLQPHTQPFQNNLKRLGIDARSRIVDAAQYQQRLNEYNCAIAAKFHNSTTPAQRQAARTKLKGWEDDLRALAAQGSNAGG